MIERYNFHTRTCSPQDRVIKEGELHLCVVLQGGPSARSRDIDVGYVERHLHRQERLSRISDLQKHTATRFTFCTD